MPEVARLMWLAHVPRAVRPLLAALATLAGRRIEARGVWETGPARSRVAFAPGSPRGACRAGATWRLSSTRSVCPVSAVPGAAAWHRREQADRGAGAVHARATCSICLPGRCQSRMCGPTSRQAVASRGILSRCARQADSGGAGLPVGVQVIGLDTTPLVGERLVLDCMASIEGAAAMPGGGR